ncbi:MAG: hypothetical protein Q8928_12765 [Bacteroidota bacterium]|nr:hypothetical protein [Bacteroidota bacterium]
MKQIFTKNLAIAIASSALILASCHGNKSDKQTASTADSTNIKEISQNVKGVVYPLPTPFEMTRMLNNIGATYVRGILNPVDKSEKYFTEKAKALNLGIYGADLAYAATYEQKQDVKLYSQSLKKLADDLGVNIDYSKLLSDEYKEKLNNKDTLSNVITSTFYDTYKVLDQKSNPNLAIMMASGMWIELMYIATHISENTYHYPGIVKIITDQKASYSKLMDLLKEHNSNADIKDLESKLLILKPVFDKIDSGLHEKDYNLILSTIQSVRKTLVS